MLSEIGTLVLNTLLGLLVYLGLLRFYMQVFRAPFRNPVGQFVMGVTDWGVQPLRRVIPAWRGLDLASVAFAFVVQFVLLLAVDLLFAPPRIAGPGAVEWLVVAILELVRKSLHLLVAVVIVDVVLAWTNQHTVVSPVLRSITQPMYGFFRRFIPPIGGFDLSPLFLILAVQIGLILLNGLQGPLLRVI